MRPRNPSPFSRRRPIERRHQLRRRPFIISLDHRSRAAMSVSRTASPSSRRWPPPMKSGSRRSTTTAGCQAILGKDYTQAYWLGLCNNRHSFPFGRRRFGPGRHDGNPRRRVDTHRRDVGHAEQHAQILHQRRSGIHRHGGQLRLPARASCASAMTVSMSGDEFCRQHRRSAHLEHRAFARRHSSHAE